MDEWSRFSLNQWTQDKVASSSSSTVLKGLLDTNLLSPERLAGLDGLSDMTQRTVGESVVWSMILPGSFCFGTDCALGYLAL